MKQNGRKVMSKALVILNFRTCIGTPLVYNGQSNQSLQLVMETPLSSITMKEWWQRSSWSLVLLCSRCPMVVSWKSLICWTSQVPMMRRNKFYWTLIKLIRCHMTYKLIFIDSSTLNGSAILILWTNFSRLFQNSWELNFQLMDLNSDTAIWNFLRTVH